MAKTESNTAEASDIVDDVAVEQEPIAAEELKPVRLLVDYADKKSGDYAELPVSVADSLIADGQADDSAEAIAFAQQI